MRVISVIRVAPLIRVVQFTQGSVWQTAYFAGLVCHAAESGLVFGCEQVKPGRNVDVRIDSMSER